MSSGVGLADDVSCTGVNLFYISAEGRYAPPDDGLKHHLQPGLNYSHASREHGDRPGLIEVHRARTVQDVAPGVAVVILRRICKGRKIEPVVHTSLTCGYFWGSAIFRSAPVITS